MSSDDDDAHDLRSFGRRRGRKPSAHQAGLLANELPQLAVDLAAPLAAAAGRPVWLEIGFGGGEHLLWQAKANPTVQFIGCEPFEDGVIKVLAQIKNDGLSNIRLHMGDARDVLRRLPEACIDRAFILFPDPWPKRKHRKRRLVNPMTLKLLAHVLRPGAELRFATDIGDYAGTALLAVLGAKNLRWPALGPADWRDRPADWPPTRYEAKAEREGRRRYYFRFERV